MVPIRPLISKPSSPCTNSLVTVPCAPITIGVTVNFIFHSFFWGGSVLKQGLGTYLPFRLPSVLPCGQPERQVLFLLLLLLVVVVVVVYHSLWVFYTSFNRWSFTGICVTTRLLFFPEIISVFWPILTMLWSGRSPLYLLFPFLSLLIPSL